MIFRPASVIALVLVVAASACSQIFPATRNEPKTASLRPRVQKEAARRRAGSDVTMPVNTDPRTLLGVLVPCDPADSAAADQRIVTECQHIDPKGDIMRPQVDTTTRSVRP
jgi:hypothetical protein